MIIREIEIENIRSHRNTRITFPDGTILFEGDIGSGKTTILMAIEFALFGNSTPKFYQRMLRKGATEGHVRVKFEVGGKEYEIYRSLVKKGKKISNEESYVITPEGKRLLSSEEVRTYVLSLMGLRVSTKRRKSLPIVTYAIYTPQETMKSILEGRDEERVEVIRKIFRLDEYRIARDNADIVQGYLEREMDKVSIWSEELERLEQEMRELESMLKEKMDKMEEVEKQLSKEEGECTEMERALEEMNRRREEHDKLSREIVAARAKIEEMHRTMKTLMKERERIEESESQLKEMEKDAMEYEKIRGEMEKLEIEMKRMREIERELAGLNGKMKSLKSELSRAGDMEKRMKELRSRLDVIENRMREFEDIEERMSDAESRHNALRLAIQRNKEKREEKSKSLEELKKIGARCPTCQRPLSEEQKKKLIEGVEKEIESIDSRIKSISAKEDKVRGEIEQLKNMERELRNLELEKERVKKDLENLSRRMEELEEKKKEVENLTEEEKRLRSTLQRMEDVRTLYEENRRRMRELEPRWKSYLNIKAQVAGKRDVERKIEMLREESDKIEERIKSMENDIEGLRYSKESHEALRTACNEKREQIAQLRERKRSLKEDIEQRREEMKERGEREEELRQRISKGRDKERMRNWIEEKFKPALEDIERMRLSAINEEFRVLFEEWFHELLGESDYDATVDENFKPIIRYEKYDMPISTLSGGERTSVALAYRLALNTMVKRALGLSNNILILDEPTDGFSKDQLYKLKDILEKMETDQIIIVSHEKELRNLADEIFLVEKVNGVSRVQAMR